MAALMARRKGDTDGARAMLAAILEQEPEHQDALEVLGMLLSEEGDQDQAIELTKRLAALNPESIMAHANISRFYMLKGDKQTAEDWQARARVLGWKEEVGRKAAAGGKASGLEGVDPAVVEQQESAVSERPDDVLARMALAQSYRKLGMPARALMHLQRALELEPSLSSAYLALGQCLEETGDQQRAAEIFEQGVPIAEARGDLMPRNQMASRLAAIQKAKTS